MESCNGEIRLEIKTTWESCGEGSYRNESSMQRNLNETFKSGIRKYRERELATGVIIGHSST